MVKSSIVKAILQYDATEVKLALLVNTVTLVPELHVIWGLIIQAGI